LTGERLNKEAAHEILKQKCNSKEIINEKTGEVLTVGGSTAEMTTTQMMEYWVLCCRFIDEWFGRYVPSPNEQCELFRN
jgi:hypothetical protein